jgi:peptide/nickel transport system ATP-binding protein
MAIEPDSLKKTAARSLSPAQLSGPTLDVRNLSVVFSNRRGPLKAIDDISFDIAAGEVLGLVGESGAGKSITGSAIISLIDPPGRIASGEIRFRGSRIDHLPSDALEKIRGRDIGMIFQDPLTSLNPLFTIGSQLVETISAHSQLSQRDAHERAVRLLDEVGIPAARARMSHYPHQFSGGMRQRVVIALALCTDPPLIIADEPTTALDVSVQSQVIALLRRLCRERRTSMLLITHDMGVIGEIADRVAVMYAGRIIEIGPVAEVISHAKHPYTQGLMGAIPRMQSDVHRLTQIGGSMPRLSEIPSGCAFHPRCPSAQSDCRYERPELRASGNSKVACILY